MEYIQVIYKCAFVLALIISYEILSIQGRQLRPKNKQDLNKLASSSTGAEQEHGVQAFRPTPTPPGKGGNSPPTTTKTHNRQFGAEEHKDAFRPAPTTPGKGPGIGHSNEQVVDEAHGQNSNGRHYVAGDKEDFRPTTPGHSPGAGHGTGKNSNGRHHVAGDKEEFWPTSPGQSRTNATRFTAIPSPGGIGHGTGKN